MRREEPDADEGLLHSEFDDPDILLGVGWEAVC